MMALLDAPAEAFGDDRVVNLPNITTSVSEMIAATEQVAARHGIALGTIEDTPDETVRAIVGAWPVGMEASRAIALGCPQDDGLAPIIEAFVEDYLT
jgi:hypothetical protein